jgi:hypothetical protein
MKCAGEESVLIGYGRYPGVVIKQKKHREFISRCFYNAGRRTSAPVLRMPGERRLPAGAESL